MNDTEVMREALISRYGLRSPQGFEVDAAELHRRRYKDKRDFADTHLTRGNVGLGLSQFMRLLAAGPSRRSTLVCLAKAAGKRVGKTARTGLTRPQ